MKNSSSLSTLTLCIALFSGTEMFAQFDSVPIHLDKKGNEHSVMFDGDIGVGFMKDEFFQYDYSNSNIVNEQSRLHFFYKLQAGAYYPMISIGKTGSFGPTIHAGVGLTRRSLSSMNLPVGVMIRFGNNSNAVTQKAWGYGLGISIAPTLYFERDYAYGSTFVKEPMLCAELSTKKVTLRLDVLPFATEKRTSPTSKIIFDSDVSLTMCYHFGKFSSVKIGR
jgi:hypothetical protein